MLDNEERGVNSKGLRAVVQKTNENNIISMFSLLISMAE